jgi:hypothetical protein
MRKYNMKSLIIILTLLTFNLSAVTFNSSITAKSNYKNLLHIYKAEYKGQVGFKVGAVYFLTDKEDYKDTIKTPNTMHMWNVYCNTDNEYLRVLKQAYVMCSYNNEDVIFTFYMDTDNVFRNVVVTFKREEL